MASNRSGFSLIVLTSLAMLFWVGLSLRTEPQLSGGKSDRQWQRTETLPPKSSTSASTHFRPHPPVEPLFALYEEVYSFPPGERDNQEIFWQEVQKTLAAVIQEKFPENRTSRRDLGELTRNIRTLRESLQDLRGLDKSSENADVRKEVRSRMDWAHQRFQETIGMSVAEFVQKARDEKGIDNEASDDEEVVIEYIPDPRP